MKKIKFLTSIAIASSMILNTGVVVAGTVTPPTVDATMPINTSMVVDKTVETPEIPPNPDIVFLADTTGSMTDAISNVRTNAGTIMSTVLTSQPTAQFAVGEYRDYGDAFVYRLNQVMTSDTTLVQNGINMWTASGGGDDPEAQMTALHDVSTGATGFRTNSTRIIVWFGDSNGHDPDGGGNTEAGATADLIAAGIQVIAVPVSTYWGNGLDTTGQATRITAATGGVLLPDAAPDQVANAILSGLSNLPITVIPDGTACLPLNVTFNPTSQTVTSGDLANFTETIAVPNDPNLAGTTQTCTVTFKNEKNNIIGEQDITIKIPLDINAAPKTDINKLGIDEDHTVTATLASGDTPVSGRIVGFNVISGPNAGKTGTDTTDLNGQAAFTYAPTAPLGPEDIGVDIIEACAKTETEKICDTVEKEWIDATPPEAACTETVNPHGKNTPPAGSTTLPGAKGGQNEDGFYLITGKDLVDPDVKIYVEDSESGIVFGPYASDTVIKYTESNKETPVAKKMGSDKGKAGAVDWHIIANGDAIVYAVDASGNQSDNVYCLVPAPPK